MKKMYQIPELQVVILDKADIITDSGAGELPVDPEGGLFHFFG